MRQAKISEKQVLSIEPSAGRIAWAVVDADGQIIRQGHKARDVRALLTQFRPTTVLVVACGGADRSGGIGPALRLAQECERWAKDLDAAGGPGPEIVALLATREDAGGPVEAARWYLDEQRAGAAVAQGEGGDR